LAKKTMTGRGTTRIVLIKRLNDHGNWIGSASIHAARGRGTILPIPSYSSVYRTVKTQAEHWARELGLEIEETRGL